MIQLLFNKTTPNFQLLPISKVDQSLLRIREAPPLQEAKRQIISSEDPEVSEYGHIIPHSHTADEPTAPWE